MNDELIKVLEVSLSRNGDKPLTIGHLLNILKLADRKHKEASDADEMLNPPEAPGDLG